MGALKHIYFFKIYIKLFQFFKCAKRLPLQDNSIFKEMEFLDRQHVFSERKSEFVFELLSKQFNLNINDISHEWRI